MFRSRTYTHNDHYILTFFCIGFNCATKSFLLVRRADHRMNSANCERTRRLRRLSVFSLKSFFFFSPSQINQINWEHLPSAIQRLHVKLLKVVSKRICSWQFLLKQKAQKANEAKLLNIWFGRRWLLPNRDQITILHLF